MCDFFLIALERHERNPDTNTDDSTEQEVEWEKTHHVYARQLCYPGSSVQRFPVPEEKVPWEVPEHTFSLWKAKNKTLSIVYIWPY